MVFVKVRETYDLHTTKNKMTVIGIHTPKPNIIKVNYPGLLMQCRAYRPVSCDVRLACASVLPLDPLGVGTAEGDVAPEDMFNPILYKAMSNKGMSQLEMRINAFNPTLLDVDGNCANADVDSFTSASDEFNIYYGLLANTHEWKHASPQAGLSMTDLRPLVYEMVYNVGYTSPSDGATHYQGSQFVGPDSDDNGVVVSDYQKVLGKAKEFPFLNTTSWTDPTTMQKPGFNLGNSLGQSEQDVPYLKVFCGCIIIPPSRLHELFFRMVVEWTIEFTGIRPLSEITSFGGVGVVGVNTHFQNYSYESTKEALTGDSDSMMESDSCMVSSNVGVDKVM